MVDFRPNATKKLMANSSDMVQRDVEMIREIKDFLDARLYEGHTIPRICRHFSINKEKLQNGFRQIVNATVHAYIVRQRMQRAAERLRDSSDSIKSIALDCGYKKQRSFNKTFKSIYRTTPAAYRRSTEDKKEL